MGFLQRASAERSSWTGPFSLNPNSGKYKDPALTRLFGSGAIAESGIGVTPQNAMTFSAVFGAVNMIASDVAKLPLNLMKRRKEGGSDHYTESKLYDLLKNEPNEEMGSMVMRRTVLAHALTCHGGFAEIQRDNLGRPHGIWVLEPHRVEPIRRTKNGPLEYRMDGDDSTILPSSEVVHIHGLGYDGINGYGTINMARQAVGLALAMERFGGQYFGRGTQFGGVLESQDDLDADQKAEIQTEIAKFRAANDAAFRIMVTGAGHKFTQFQNRPADSQMDESRLRQVEEVCRFFRIPPVKLGVNRAGAVSYASVEMQNIDYYTGAMLDWVTLCEQEFNRKLIAKSERRQQFIKHNANAFLRADTASRSKFYDSMLDRGVFNADDVLALEDLNPQPNGQGQMYLVQGAQVPKDKMRALVDAQINAKTTPQVSPAPAAPVVDTETDALRARLEDAERALASAQADLLAQREARIAADAAGTATREELDARRTEESSAVSLAHQLTATVDALRADLVAAQAAGESQAERIGRLETEAESARIAAEAAESTATTLRSEVAAAVLARDTQAAEAADARSLVATAEQAALDAGATVEQARTARDTAEQRAQSAETSAAVSAAEVARLQAELAGAACDVTGLTEDRDRLASELESARAALATADEAQSTLRGTQRCQTCHGAGLLPESSMGDPVGQQTCPDCPTGAALAAQFEAEGRAERSVSAVADAEQRATDAIATANTAAESLAAAQTEAARVIEASTAAVTQAHSELETARGLVETTEQARAAAVADAGQARRQTEEWRVRTVAAHRSLFVDAVGRMARREAQQARSRQATPAKLRRWLSEFPAMQMPVFAEAIAPALRTHLAWLGAPDSPTDEALLVARAHLDQFVAKVTDVIDHAEPADFHAELDRMLTRWENERPEAVADALMEKEIRHVA